MHSQQLKHKFIQFFESKGHHRISNSSLIPENDPSALFTNSGMHPLVRFLTGEPHPLGVRLVNYQRAVRTGDIENVGVTKRHHTFFEMLGEWSLGDYWKKESLEWSVEFMVDVLGLDPKRLYATVFRGNDSVAKDEEAIEIWKNIFTKYGIEPTIGDEFLMENCPRIITLDEEDNFWPKGRTKGPCGPCSEIYYDLGTGEDTDSRYLELCNNVFMGMYQEADGAYRELDQKNIDVGWGYERILSVLQNKDENGDVPNSVSNFETDLFESEKQYLLQSFELNIEDYDSNPVIRRDIRAILDHIRASVMIIADGIEPSNKDQGYILRRLIRRATTFGWKYKKDENLHILLHTAELFFDKFCQDEEYRFMQDNKTEILLMLKTEIEKFEKALRNGIKELNKVQGTEISGEIAFRLKEALGLPLEITLEIAQSQGKKVDVSRYEVLMDEHQAKSRGAGEKKFVGGLGDHTTESIRYHTCAHLLLAGAQKLLDANIHQKGQNITSERLRYDINYPTPIPVEKITELENWINKQISKDLKVDFIEVTLEEAQNYGVEGVFGDKYAKLDKLKVYRIYPKDADISRNLVPEDKDKYISLELCGGPHVEYTSQISELGKFKITKEESAGAGVRRVRGEFVK
jgi:alanyl-tRNA synthetase